MPRKKRPSSEDIELFRRMVGPVNPMRTGNRSTNIKKHKPNFGRIPQNLDSVEDRTDLHDAIDAEDFGADDHLSFVRPGVQHSQIRKMRKGHYAIRSELDFHGLTTTQARRELVVFLQQSRSRGERCVRIIHGKGYNSPNRRAILKSRLNVWLRQCEEVLAFCSAPVKDGGTGAAYVLLRTY
jgi:DNA-nicking Smr family endonuclease